ncbi:MAG: hypothetical protein KIT79_10725 [Deltaproteobacteria bacterium]|nr:hypothetical protein [Deltaproteobacteria bacterium]
MRKWLQRVVDFLEELLDIPSSAWKWLAPTLLVSIIALGWLLYPLGIHADDYLEALTARRSGWKQLLTFQGAPVPLLLSVWKLALPFSDGPPSGILRVAAATVHIINSVLVYAALCGIFSRYTRLAAAMTFFAYRGGNWVLLWAATFKDALMTLFVLLAVILWRRGMEHPRCRLWASLPAAAAMMCKPTAIVLAPLLLLHQLWMEDRDSWTLRLQKAAGGLLLVSSVLGALLANALLNPGIWSGYTPGRGLPDIEYAPLYLAGMYSYLAAWSLLPVSPDLDIQSQSWLAASGFIIICGIAAAFFRFDRMVKWGIAWHAAFTALPLYANGGMPSPHYSYAAAFGLTLAVFRAGGLVYRRSSGARPAILVVGILWLAGTLVHWPSDLRLFHRMGKAGQDARHVILAHKDDVLASGRVYATSPHPRLLPLMTVNSHLFEFELGNPVRVVHPQSPACPATDGIPCLYLAHSKAELAACTSNAADSCMIWTPATRNP